MKNGFTLVELLAVIVILAIIALIATPIILGIISNSKKEAFKDTAYGIVEAAKNEYIKSMYKNETPSNITFTYTNNEESSSVVGKSLNYSGSKPKDGVVELTSTGDVAIAIHDGTLCAYKSYGDNEVVVETKTLSECTTDYSVTKGVNTPKLTQGMTPIKWDGSKWIETNVSDKEWYSYDTTNKKWANAKTADGSMWVWIPRYAYQIATNYHLSPAGVINIKFLQGTSNIASDGSTITTTPVYNGSSQTNYIIHSGFKFGTTDVSGMWVPKFTVTATEGLTNTAAGDDTTNKTIKIIPNVIPWQYITVGNAFTVSRNMEMNATYGWGTDGSGIDTHLMKNVEWGAIAYFARSTYGKNTEIVMNIYTGGGIDAAYASNITKSTTGNIYGIYDMVTNINQYVAAYVNNGNTNLTTYGLSVINADIKYKDVYSVASTDSATNNYALAINKKGDAIYETSNAGQGSASWFSDWSLMPNDSGPWMSRSGNSCVSYFDGTKWVNAGCYNGIFNFSSLDGNNTYGNLFRPILLVDTTF